MPSSVKGWLQTRVTHNWELKLLALLLAGLSYYAIRGATGYEVEYSVPVEVAVEPGVAVLEQDPDVLRVRFRGSQDDLLRLDQKHLKAVVRPRGDNPDGTPRLIPVTSRDIAGAPGVAVVKIEPGSVAVTFDRETEMTFSVAKPTTIGRPLIGRAELTYTPQKVSIRGPKRRLEELKTEGRDEVTTEPVDVDGRVESFSKRVRVRPPGGTWVAGIEPSEVAVQVNIVKASASRTWQGLPVLAIQEAGPAAEIYIRPPRVDITVEGRAELIENLAEADIRIFIDCIGLNRTAAYELPVQVHLPVYNEVKVKVEPSVVEVSFGDAATRKGGAVDGR